MTSAGYENLWSSKGRDDFGIMKALGANAVRLYHPIGYESDPHIQNGKQPEVDHSLVLNAAKDSGLNVFAAVHQDLPCVNDDCFSSWSTAVKRGLASGFSQNSRWHPAVWAVNMINEVDAMVVPSQDAHKYVKRIISAVDGLLAAEASLGVKGNVNLTNCFTTAIAKPLGSDSSSVYHGFSSMEAWIKDTSLIDYVPKSTPSLAALAQEVDRRWVHCVNAQIPWSGLKSMIAPDYARFLPRPWIVGEMGFNGAHTDDIQKQLEDMSTYAEGGHGYAGNFFFQFQTAYFKKGSELNYGMFGLGSSSLKYSVTLWQGKSQPVQCLTSRLWPFEQPGPCGANCNHRAQAVAKAWGGNLVGDGLCLNSNPLVPEGVGHESVAVDIVV